MCPEPRVRCLCETKAGRGCPRAWAVLWARVSLWELCCPDLRLRDVTERSQVPAVASFRAVVFGLRSEGRRAHLGQRVVGVRPGATFTL